jgi:hypothetical protein
MKKYCIDCNKEIKNFYAERCKSCAKKFQYAARPDTHPMLGKKGNKHHGFGKVGELSTNWKGGLPHCEDCGKKLCKRGYKKCHSCMVKYLYKIGILNTKGSKNGNWNGGSSFEPYSLDWTKDLKETIRKRDNYICQNCGMTEEEHLIVIGKVLTVHHINYNKQNCKEDNLITLCHWCNLRANLNRDYWENYYKQKMEVLK